MRQHRGWIPGRVLIDSSAHFILSNAQDINHARAIARVKAKRQHLYTTTFSRAETHGLLLRRLGRWAAVQFLKDFDHNPTVVVRVSAGDEQRAREIIFSHTDKEYSLTDATSFAVLERLRIGTAFTFDRHFAQYGFAVLGPDEP